MPDRPKRRRNNKNKRKNKNSPQSQQEKGLSDSVASSASETCDTEVKDELSEKRTDPCSTSDDRSRIDFSSKTSNENSDNANEINQSHKEQTEVKQEKCHDEKLEQAPQLNGNSQKTINDVLSEIKCISGYIVESPKQSSTNVPKLGNTVKSRSLDNDDVPKIIEITDDSGIPSEEEGKLPVIDCSNIVVSEAESDVEWETAETLETSYVSPKEIAVGTLNIETIPLNVAQCEHNQVLTPEEELSLRQYLQSLDLTTHPPNLTSLEVESHVEIENEVKHRLRKKAMADDFFRPRISIPRFLDVIDEEGSSESSAASRRQSQLSETKKDFDDLDDDVFVGSKNQHIKSEKYPALMSATNRSYKRLVQNIPQECFLVGAKIIEPNIMEAKGDWTMKTVEKMKGAEVVYLTDSSSSASDIYDINDENELNNDTDVSVRITTPTIEVTDTESLLKSVAQNKVLMDNQEKTKTIFDGNKTVLNNDASFQDRYIPLSNLTDVRPSDESHPHEILVLSTDDIKTDLYVLDSVEEIKKEIFDSKETLLESNKISTSEVTEPVIAQNKTDGDMAKSCVSTPETNKNKKNEYHDVEIKVLKCELNDAFNNLLKEVSSDSDVPNEEPPGSFLRQDSSSSIGSSQCTAKYNPNYSSFNDLGDAIHEETKNINNLTQELNFTSDMHVSSHVKDVLKSLPGTTESRKELSDYFSKDKLYQPKHLRELCLKKITTFPYGEKILEELASVSERLQNINVITAKVKAENQTTRNEKQFETPRHSENLTHSSLNTSTKDEHNTLCDGPTLKKEVTPPPVKPRRSSRKKSQEDGHWTDTSTKTEPVYVCLSPSQKMLMEKTNTKITKEDINYSNDLRRNSTEKRSSDHQNYKSHDEQGQMNKPNAKFKSQTGNRLLAILRDPTITSTINRVNKNSLYKSLDNLGSTCKHWGTKSPGDERYDQKASQWKDLNTDSFTPIPPPRPRHYSSTAYETSENFDFVNNSFRSMKNERKQFHYSTGNLSKEIENDISSIQNLHRNYTSLRKNILDSQPPRRPSLPKELCDVQMDYIRKKELEVQNEIRRLESRRIISPEKRIPRAPVIKNSEKTENSYTSRSHNSLYKNDTLFNKDSVLQKPLEEKKSSFRSSQEELMRERMYSEYVCEMAERHERKQQKIIKITNNSDKSDKISKSLSALHLNDTKANNIIEEEFISKAKERWNKLGIRDPETEDERETRKDVYREPKVIEHKIKVIEGDTERDVQKLPKHLQDFVRFTAKNREHPAGGPAIWRPGAPSSLSPGSASGAVGAPRAPPPPPPPPPPVWSPCSAGASPRSPRRTFRPVHFEETPPPTRKLLSTVSGHNGCGSESESESRGLRTSLSAPASGLRVLGEAAPASAPPAARLPRAQNPTVTLLQKAREGHTSKSSNYSLESDSARLPRDRATPPKGDPVHALRREYASESEAEKREDESAAVRRMADTQKKVDVGPTTRDGMPVSLRSEVRDPSRWYKKMYDTIHKTKLDDDCVTIRYKSRRGQPIQRVSPNKSQYAYFDPRSGYLSEPEGGLSRLGSSTWSDAYDSDVTAGSRRRTASVQEERHHDDITSPYLPSNKYSTLASARASQEVYKNQPGRIEDYVPGRSSVVDKEAKQWWDEVMDIFDGQLSSTTSLPQASPKEKKDITSTILSKSNMARALKESGYESDSTLVFRRRDETEPPLSPAERRAAYRDLQAGGEPPLRGFRSPAPPRHEGGRTPDPPRRTTHTSSSDTESPRRYLESDVNIHYRCPVRRDPLPLVPERELERQQADHMRRLYREQRRAKYMQELQDMQNRRHQDNFTPSQKAIVPLNRYDEAGRVLARALYTFSGQTPRELSFTKGEIINVQRQIDANWYEGELRGRTGLFPYNYVEILKGEATQTQKRPAAIEGRARAKFDFTAQTGLELPLKKGEIVVLTRRIDHNWWEGRHGNKTGIFPDSYVTVLQEPTPNKPELQTILTTDKPVASPASHGLLNGTAKRSMGAHSYTPQLNSPALSNAPPATQPLPGYVAKPAHATLTTPERGYGPPPRVADLNNTEPLYVDTNAEAVPYRAMYKYRPQNPDELELREGDTVYVLEKCDDGWYVGSSQRTGRLGTFPGNYVERI